MKLELQIPFGTDISNISGAKKKLLNVDIHDLPHFRVSSKLVAGSISQGVNVFDFNVVPLSKQIWVKTWLLNFWAATGVPSLFNESFGTEPGN